MQVQSVESYRSSPAAVWANAVGRLRRPAAGRAHSHLRSSLVAIIAFFCLTPAGQAQDYPNRPIHLVVGFAAGSSPDILTRFFGKQLESVSGGTVIVEAKPGASGNLAAALVANAKPDGYTLLISSNSSMAGARFFQKDISFDTLRDFTPITSVVEATTFFAVGVNSPVQDLAGLIARSKSRPQNRYGYTSTVQLLAGQYLATKAGFNIEPVAYRTTSDSIADLQEGTLEFAIIERSTGLAAIKAGKIRAIASVGARRIPGVDVPTLAEGGFEGADFSTWFALLAPKHAPDAVIAKLTGWAKQAMNAEETINFYKNMSMTPLPQDEQDATTKRIERDISTWESLVKAAGITPQ